MTAKPAPEWNPKFGDPTARYIVGPRSGIPSRNGETRVMTGAEIVANAGLNPVVLLAQGKLKPMVTATDAPALLSAEDQKPPKPPEPPLAEAPTDDLTGATNSATPKATLKKK